MSGASFDNRQLPQGSQVGGVLQGASNTHILHSNLNEISGNYNNVVFHSNLGPNNGRSLYHLLQPVNASYSNRTGKKARCMFGSRKDVLDKIKAWANKPGQPICWLNGPAGSGKSTIAQTIAEWCTEDERLAASFFFFRGTGDRDNINRLIATLAFQLSNTVSHTKSVIKKAISVEPSITNMSLDYQFSKLIMEPMLSSRLRKIFSCLRKPMIMVIDALDECSSQMDEFIDAVVDAYGSRKGRVSLRIFVTSRVEEHLRVKLETPAAKDAVLQLKLQDFDASEDIRAFFQSEFKRIYDENLHLMRLSVIPEPWPSPQVLDTVVERAAGSYIYASTFVDFISLAQGMPHEKLVAALEAHGLDSLYTQVFSNASSQNPAVDGDMVDLKRVIGSLVVLKHPLAINAHAFLLGVSARDLVKSLLRIQSILVIPESDDTPVHFLHTSLRDFLTTQSRSGDYSINPPASHIAVAVDCLKIILTHSGDMPSRDNDFLYAHWNFMNHLHEGLRDNEQYCSDFSLLYSLKDDLTHFVGSLYDNWIDTCIKKYYLSSLSASSYPRLELPSCPPELQSILDNLNEVLMRAQILSTGKSWPLVQDFKDYNDRDLYDLFRQRRRDLLYRRDRQYEEYLRRDRQYEYLLREYYEDDLVEKKIREWREARTEFIARVNNTKTLQELQSIYDAMSEMPPSSSR